MTVETRPENSNTPERRLVITVHGIRTFGGWQENLETLLGECIPDSALKVINYKYGYFSILAFIIPIFRWLVVRRFRKELIAWCQAEKWDRIDLVGHSFGTHVLTWALHGIPHKDRPKIHTIILSGSVLRGSFPWRDLVSNGVERVVNDCGAKDSVLIINQLFVLFTGMAGRAGFGGATHANFRNRFFEFGHSGYFYDAKGKPGSAWMAEFWLPLLTTDHPIEPYDEREPPGVWDGIIQTVANNAEPVKLTVYLAPFAALGLWIWGLYVDEASARLEAEKQTTLVEHQSAFLSAENSYQLTRRGENDRALLHLLDATHAFDSEAIPDELTVALHNSVQRASREDIYRIPVGTQVFPGAPGFLFHDPKDQYVYFFDGSGPPSALVEVTHENPVLSFFNDGFIVVTDAEVEGYYALSDGLRRQTPTKTLNNLFSNTSDADHVWSADVRKPFSDTDTDHLYSNYSSQTPKGHLFLNFRNELTYSRTVSAELQKSENFASTTRAASLDSSCATHTMPPDVARSVASTPSYGDLGCRKSQSGFIHTVTNGGSAGTFNYEYAYKQGDDGTWHCIQFWGRDVALWSGEFRDMSAIADNNLLRFNEVFWHSSEGDTEQREFICQETFREEEGQVIEYPAPIFAIRYVTDTDNDQNGKILVALPSTGQLRTLDADQNNPGITTFSSDEGNADPAQPLPQDAAFAQRFCTFEYDAESSHLLEIGDAQLDLEIGTDASSWEATLDNVRLAVPGGTEKLAVPKDALETINRRNWLQRCVFVSEQRQSLLYQGEEALYEVSLSDAEQSETTSVTFDLGLISQISSDGSKIVSDNESGVWMTLLTDGKVSKSERVYLNPRPILNVSADESFENLVVNMEQASDITAVVYSIPAKQTWREFGPCYKHCGLSHLGGRSYNWTGRVAAYDFDVPTAREVIPLAEAHLSTHCRDFVGRDYASSSCF